MYVYAYAYVYVYVYLYVYLYVFGSPPSDELDGERQLKIPKRTHGDVHPQVGTRQVHQSTKSKASAISVKSDVSIGPGSVRDQFVEKSDKAQQSLSLSRGSIPLPDEPHSDNVPLRRKLFEEKQSALVVKKASPIKNSPVVAKSGGMDVPPRESHQGQGWIGASYERSSGSWQGWTPYQNCYAEQARQWSSSQRARSWDSQESPRKRNRAFLSPKDYGKNAKKTASGLAATDYPEWLVNQETCMFWPFSQMESLVFKFVQAHLGEEFMAVAIGHLSRRLCSDFRMKNLESV